MNKKMNKIRQKYNLDLHEKEKEINKLKEKIKSLEKSKNDIIRSNSDNKKSKIIYINKEISNLSKVKTFNFPIKIIKRKKNSDIKNILFFNKSQVIKNKSPLNFISLSLNNCNKPEFNTTIIKKKKESNNLFNKQKTNINFNLSNKNQEKSKIHQIIEEQLKILDNKINNFKNRNKKEKKIKINQRAKSCIRRDILLNKSSSLSNFRKKNNNKSNINNSVNLEHMNITLRNIKKSYIDDLKKKKMK